MNSSEKTLYKNENFEVRLRFLGGGSGKVTGSSSLLTIIRDNDEKNILIDCGMFQGKDEELNFERKFEPENIDAVILTHSHLDHCGMVPSLFKEKDGIIPYKGHIYGSTETLNQATHILIDAAIINEREANFTKKDIDRFSTEISKHIKKSSQELDKIIYEKGVINSSSKIPNTMIEIEEMEDAISTLEEELDKIPYTVEDVETAIKSFKYIDVPADINDLVRINICDGIYFKLLPNSHINGATIVEIYISYKNYNYAIAFSGDIGKKDSILYKSFEYPEEEKVNALVIESLHGIEKPIENIKESKIKLEGIIRKAVKEHRPCIIPVFALDRMAMFVEVFNELIRKGICKYCYIDSPLGTKELQEYINSYNSASSAWFDYSKVYPFYTYNFNIIKNYKDHINLVKFADAPIVLTSSCMGWGGRVRDYFDQYIQDKRAIFVFPGYLIEDSPSRSLVETPKGEIFEIFGNRFKKNCDTYWLHGFSSHGYFEDKLQILSRYINIDKLFLNHGEEKDMEELSKKFSIYTNAKIELAEINKEYKLL